MRSSILASAALLALPLTLAAQEPGITVPAGPIRGYAGAGLAIAAPVGTFGDYVSGAIGAAGHFGWNATPNGPLSLRADVGVNVYGHERRRIPFPTAPRVSLDLTTTNNILTYAIGPQLMATSGSLRPYINGFVGGAYFFTQSSLSGTGNDGQSFAQSENFHDNVLSYGGGGGFLIPISAGRAPVAIDIGARYLHNGTVRYLREGDIHEDGNTVTYTPTVSPANYVQFTIGVSVNVR